MESPRFTSLGRRWHRRLDSASGGLLLFLAAFAPWGAGGTLYWSSWVLIGTGWLLGALVLSKWALVRWTGYEPTQWKREGGAAVSHWPTRALGILTGLILLQVLVSLFNYRAEVNWTSEGVDFIYRDAIEWLPTTYDVAATRKAFFRYLAFAGVFWAMRDWLLIKSRSERHREEDGRDVEDGGRVPDRLKWLGWVISVNGAVMALVGILHRLDGAKDLLWMINLKQMSPEGMFGSFPYRANAAQYLNLIWPLALGFWWALRSDALRPTSKPTRTGSQAYPMLLLCVALMVAAVFVAASRGGIAVTLVEMALAMIVLGRAMKGWQPRLGMALAFLTALGLGWGLAGDFLAKRFTNSLVDESMSGRTQIFEIARRMTADFPLWGSGAESFLTLNGLYRVRALDKWHGYVHDDWLETRVTFGWVGLLVVVLMLASAASAKWVSGRVPIHRELAWLLAIGLAGMLGHAFGDFPFQMPALHVSFLVGAAVFSVVGAPMKTKAIPGSQPREQR
jgi:hypothetical protein